MKAIDYLSSLIAGQKMGSSIPVQVCELEMLKTFLEIEQTMAEGHAALAGTDRVNHIATDPFFEWWEQHPTLPRRQALRKFYESAPKDTP